MYERTKSDLHRSVLAPPQPIRAFPSVLVVHTFSCSTQASSLEYVRAKKPKSRIDYPRSVSVHEHTRIKGSHTHMHNVRSLSPQSRWLRCASVLGINTTRRFARPCVSDLRGNMQISRNPPGYIHTRLDSYEYTPNAVFVCGLAALTHMCT